MNNKVVFGSVIYKNAIDYLDEFLESLFWQSAGEFDLLLLNDDISNDDLAFFNRIFNNHRVILIKAQEGRKPFELRIQLLIEAKKLGYDLLILGDCDDKFSVNRVENIIDCHKKYSEYSFYYNDLLTFEQNKVIDDFPDETNSIEQILECNYLGLSNTSLNLKKFETDWLLSLYEGNTFVFDWYLYSRILLNGGMGKYVNHASTFYRIYDGNFAGLNSSKKENLKKEYDVKLKHYELLAPRSERYNDLYKKYRELDIDNYNSVNVSTCWWSNINILK